MAKTKYIHHGILTGLCAGIILSMNIFLAEDQEFARRIESGYRRNHLIPNSGNGVTVLNNTAGLLNNSAGLLNNGITGSNNAAGLLNNANGLSNNGIAASNNAAGLSDNDITVSNNAAGLSDNDISVSSNAAGSSDNDRVIPCIDNEYQDNEKRKVCTDLQGSNNGSDGSTGFFTLQLINIKVRDQVISFRSVITEFAWFRIRNKDPASRSATDSVKRTRQAPHMLNFNVCSNKTKIRMDHVSLK